MAVRAQDDPQYRMEIGAGVGVMTYEGDFNGNVLGDMQPAGFLWEDTISIPTRT